MPHPEVPPASAEITITIDQPRRVRIDLWAMYLAEEELTREARRRDPQARQVSLLTHLSGSELTVADVLLLLWGGLHSADAECVLTRQEVGHLLHPGNLPQITRQLTQLWNTAVGEPSATGTNGQGAPEADPPPAGTGPSSGVTPASILAAAPESSGASPR